MKAKLVEIEWHDSASLKGIWHGILDEIKDYKKDGLSLIKTVGYLIMNEKKYIVVIQSQHFNSDMTVTNGAGFFQIPKGCISKIRYLK